jgi:hypothetical protein
MNEHAFNDYVIKQGQADRKARAAQQTAIEVERAARLARARDLIHDRMSDLLVDGKPCDWAVWSILDLWSQYGEGNVKAAQVRALYGERRRELVERLGWDPWTTDGLA